MSSQPVPTRQQLDALVQQLDDLDVLMQRMLALPVLDPENDVPAAAPAPVVEITAPPAPPALADMPAPLPREAPPAYAGGSQSPPAYAGGSHKPEILPEVEIIAPLRPKYDWLPERPADPQETAPIVEPPARLARRRRIRPRAAWLLEPLVWGNVVFERCVGQLGSPGRWLCAEGRLWLGLVGLLLLLATAGWWIIDRLAWTLP